MTILGKEFRMKIRLKETKNWQAKFTLFSMFLLHSVYLNYLLNVCLFHSLQVHPHWETFIMRTNIHIRERSCTAFIEVNDADDHLGFLILDIISIH